MAAEGAASKTGRASPGLPYPASWVDHLTDAIDRLPGPAWAFYLVLLTGVALLINGADWIAGQDPPGTFDPAQSGYAVYGVYMLALIHYLNREAGSKIESFRPALDIRAAEYERLRYEVTTLPARQGRSPVSSAWRSSPSCMRANRLMPSTPCSRPSSSPRSSPRR
jgi:hypothetical protein